LHSDEEVDGVVRQFTASLMTPFTISGALTVLAFYFFVPLWNLHLWKWDISIVGRVFFILVLLYAFLHSLRAYVIWRGTMLIITNQRVIDVDRRGLFDRIVSEVPYQSLSDVSYRSKGFIEMTANIGTITFQMYSGNENISFHRIMNPAALHKQILELRVAHNQGTPKVADPVEGMINTVGNMSPTEQRALLAGLKKTVPPMRPAKTMKVKKEKEIELP